jgi:hypothetical protein
MMGDAQREATAPGSITRGIERDTLEKQTIAFVKDQLATWRDHPDRVSEQAEEKLNAQLCKFLNIQARRIFPMAHFHHEERQAGRARVDISASPTELISAALYADSIFEPFLVLEAKRLPAPAAGREREYVTGYEARSGGIQRFKLGLHAPNHETAVMIGYVQKGALAAWLAKINGWIAELVEANATDGCVWHAGEELVDYEEDDLRGTARSLSRHQRHGDPPGNRITLYHLWVSMFAKGGSAGDKS